MSEIDKHATQPRSSPKVVAPTKRVNVAFPFSHLHVDESSRDVVELAALVADLAGVVEEAAPGPKAEALRQRARILTTRLQ